MSSAHFREAVATSARRRRRLQSRRLLTLESLETRRVFAPVITSLVAAGINEGNNAVATIDFTDPQLLTNQYRLQFDWGDGSGSTTTPIDPANITIVDAATGAMRTTVSKFFADDNPTNTPADTFTIRAAIYDQTEVSYWNFDEASGATTIDSFSDNDGTIGGTAARATGLVGPGSIEFHHAGGETVNVGNSASLAATDGFAFEALIRPNWQGNGNAMIYRKDDGDNRILFGLQSDNGFPLRLTIGINVGGYDELELLLDTDLSTVPGGVAGAGTVYLNPPGVALGPNDVVLQDGNTHHVVAGYEQATGETSIWIDGVKRFQKFDAAGTPMLSGGAENGHIGSDRGGEVFAGTIDEVVFYNRAVSPLLIANHAARGRNGQEYFFSTTTLTVSNAAPVINAGGAATLFEGESFTRNGSIVDGVDTFTSATVDYGDGTGVQPLALVGNNFALSHVYADNGSYTVSISVTDDDTGVGSTSFVLTVLNAIPNVAAPGAPQSTTEGALYAFTLNFVDFGTADTHTAVIDWGDGTTSGGVVTETPTGPPGNVAGLSGTVAANHVYADDGPNAGTYTVTVTVTDDNGGVGTTAFLVTVGNANPVLTPLVAPQSTLEGTAYAFALSFSDLGTLDTHTALINWGDGTTSSALVTETPFGPPGSVTGLTGTLAGNHVYADNGAYTVTVTLTDDNGGSASTGFQVLVGNVDPVLSTPAPQSTTEGSLYSLLLSFNDAGTLDTHTATIDWGDTTSSTGASLVVETPFGPPGSTLGLTGSVAATHVYADEGSYTVIVTLTDDNGGLATRTFVVTVGNANPVIAPVVNLQGAEGVPYLLVAPFNDPGTRDTHIASINWGDGITTAGTVNETPFGPPGSVTGLNGTINGSHTYANNGNYTVVITLTDDNGGVSTRSIVVAIADVPPVVTIVGPDGDTTVRGLPTEFTFTADDVPPDMVGGYTFDIEWGDGTTESVAVPDNTVTLTHVFQTEGLKSITAVATGADGVASDGAGLDITVTVVGTMIDPDTGFTNAVVGGSIFADRIVLSLLYSGAIQARINNKNYVIPDADGKIIVYGQDGGDTISVANNVAYDVDMYGQAGNDYLAGGIYHDMLDGGAGNDRLMGGNGNNVYFGGDGNDVITGGNMSETADGGAGIDSIDGKGGDDFLDGGAGNDKLVGGIGNDLIRGGAGTDIIRGDAGHDILIGGDGNDSLYGSVGRDILVGGRGSDQMYAGTDDDILIHASTDYDDNDPFFDEIWLSIQAVWLQPGTVQDRIDEMAFLPFGLDESVIPNDNVRDSLYGELDDDWFLVANNDSTFGFKPGDVKTVLYI